MDFWHFCMVLFWASLISATPLTKNHTKSEVKDEKNYRLSSIYTPSIYEINITVPAESFTEQSSEFTGTVQVTFTVTEKTNYAILHASHDYITIKNVSLNSIELEASDYSVDDDTDIFTVNFTAAGGLAARRSHKLLITYTGKLSTSDMYGFYKSSYQDSDNSTKYVATTQFEPTYARRAFPCFDEPSFKAYFIVSLTYPKGKNALHNTNANVQDNTDESTTTVTFTKTPKMSTYLVAFIISDFYCTQGEDVEGKNVVPYQVCSREQSTNARTFAVDIGPKLLRALNNYTAYNYSNNLAKMDQVAIPDFAAGAMENWGLVTYRETALLWDENESSNNYKQRVATVIAHEFTHQWFGNLVTCKWWSETFINEGFAAFFQDFITHMVLPEWQMDKQFVIQTLHSVLEADALENAQALQSNASTPAEISAKFGTITYNKGASIIRMVQNIMGADNFQAGLQEYLKGLKNSNAEPEQLWTYLKAAVVANYSNLPDDFNTVMKNWVVNPGYPLITVSNVDDTIRVSQERFLLSGEDKTSKWYVPVSFSVSNNDTFNSTHPMVWLTPNDTSKTLIEKSDWIIINNQQTGYFRVNYEESIWKNIITALKASNFSNIPTLNRAQIVDDAFSLAKTGKIAYSLAFQIVEFLENDVSYFSWYPALNGFNYLIKRVGLSSDLGKNISAHVLRLMSKFYASVPISKTNETDQIYTLSQVMAASGACKLGDANCIKEVKEIFSQFKTNSTKKPDKNLKSVVYCNALRYSENTTDWDYLWEYYTSTDIATEQVTLLTALGCTKNVDKLKEYLVKTITDNSGIRSQDSLSAFAAVYNGNDEGVDVAFEFLIANHTQISDKYQSMNSLGNLIKGIAERFTTEAQVTKLKDFIDTGNLSDSFKVSANEALETAQANLAWIKQYKASLESYYTEDPGSSTGGDANQIAVSLFLVSLSVVLNKLL